jgi:hypothetical protein
MRYFPVLSALALLAGCTSGPSEGPDPGPELPVAGFSIARGGGFDGTFLASWTAASGVTWAAGTNGTVLRYDGLQWTLEPFPNPVDIITGLAGLSDGATLFAAAGSEVYERRDDGWFAVASASGSILLGAWTLDDDHIYAFGSGGRVLHRTAGAWSELPPINSAEIWGIWGSSPDSLIAVGQSSGIFTWDAPTETWTAQPSPVQAGFFAITGDGTGRVLAVGTGGTVIRRDGQGSWEPVTVPTTQNLFSVWSTGPGNFLIAGDGGVLLEGDGVTFTSVAVPAGRENLRAISGSPGKRVAVGWWGTVLDESLDWMPSLTGARLYGIHAPADGAPLVVGAGGLGFERTGGAWRPVAIPAPATLFTVVGPSASQRLAVGDSGTILRYSGGSWRPEVSPYPGLLRSAWWDGGTQAMIIGGEGTALVSEGGGWRTIPTGTTRNLRHLWGRAWNDLWAVGDSGTVLRFDGANWRSLTTPAPADQNLRGVWGATPEDIWVVGDAGTLLRFNGTTWTRVLAFATDLRAVRGIAGQLFIVGGAGGIWRWTGAGFETQPLTIAGYFLGIDGGGTRGLTIVGEQGTIVEGR